MLLMSSIASSGKPRSSMMDKSLEAKGIPKVKEVSDSRFSFIHHRNCILFKLAG